MLNVMRDEKRRAGRKGKQSVQANHPYDSISQLHAMPEYKEWLREYIYELSTYNSTVLSYKPGKGRRTSEGWD